MVKRRPRPGSSVVDSVDGSTDGAGGAVLVDPSGGQIHVSAVDLADCPSLEDDEQRVLAGLQADRLVADWWADPVAAQAEWEAELAALYAQVAEGDRQAALERRAVLDGAPRVASLSAALEVLDGAAAWTPAQAAVEGFVDDLQDGVVSGFTALQRLQNHLLWLQLRCAETVARAWTGRTPTLPRKTRSGRTVKGERDALVNAAVAAEFALAAGITHDRAAAVVEAASAVIVQGRLPLTGQALQDGRLDWARLRLIVSRTRDLTRDDTHAVEALVYADPKALNGGAGRFETALTAAVLRVDADAEAKRRARHRKGRRVSIQSGVDGAAWFTATGPGEAVTAAYNGLDAAARYLRAHGDPRTLDQLRHDLFVTGCTSGYLPVPADLLPVPPGCVLTDPTAPSAEHESSVEHESTVERESAPSWFTSTWPDVQVSVNVTVSAETLMGLVNAPGTLHGYGPIPADAIRDLVKNGVFRCLVVDDEHGTVLGVGKNTFTPGYTASERLKLLVEHAFPMCNVPWCGKAAWRCDLDHQTPHADGGVTCECNMRPLCRGCHRLKTAGLLVPEQCAASGDGPSVPPGTTTTWTTRTGRAYTTIPHVPLPQGQRPATSAGVSEDQPSF